MRSNKRNYHSNRKRSDVCRICRGQHQNIQCPLTIFNDISMCRNCNQGQHKIMHCPSLQTRCSSSYLKSFLTPYVYGNEDSYRKFQTSETDQNPDSPRKKSYCANSQAVYIHEERIFYNEKNGKKFIKSVLKEEQIPEKSHSITIIDNDDFYSNF